MTLGEQFKQLRMAKGFSQPELAEKAQIEQSYLSKLENDKSLPSNEVFRRLLTAFELTVEELIAPFEAQYINENLMVISDIEYCFKQKTHQQFAQQRKLLYWASAFIILAVTLFYTGVSKELFSETQYEYYSAGIVLEGEPNNIFRNWTQLIDDGDGYAVKKIEMAKRSDIVHLLTVDYQGKYFVMTVKGGKRFYHHIADRTKQVPRAINAWLQILGALFFSAGVMAFILERRLFKLS